ncbi:MAG: hypothetical protein ACRC0F_07145 [Cetobacterium sp.]
MNIYEYCYSKREMMIHDTTKKSTLIKKLQFKLISYFANKF